MAFIGPKKKKILKMHRKGKENLKKTSKVLPVAYMDEEYALPRLLVSFSLNIMATLLFKTLLTSCNEWPAADARVMARPSRAQSRLCTATRVHSRKSSMGTRMLAMKGACSVIARMIWYSELVNTRSREKVKYEIGRIQSNQLTSHSFMLAD